MERDIRDRNRDRRAGCCNKKSDGLPIIGIFFVGLGIVFLLDRLQILPPEWKNIIISWQALLIFIGVINIFRRHAQLPGFILILVGSAFLVPDIVHIPFEARQLIWPVLLIAIGMTIIMKARNLKKSTTFTTINDDCTTTVSSERIDEVAIFGGGKRVITTQNLKGGNITAIFGGLEIDLSDADIDGESAMIEVTTIFGGATVIVKSEWDVQIQVASVLGGFSDKRKVYKSEKRQGAKTLIIKGAAVFGGGEVKSF